LEKIPSLIHQIISLFKTHKCNEGAPRDGLHLNFAGASLLRTKFINIIKHETCQCKLDKEESGRLFKCKPSLGAYEEESGRLFKCKPSLGAYEEESGRLFNNKKNYDINVYTVSFF
jgi:hypothetical protein